MIPSLPQGFLPQHLDLLTGVKNAAAEPSWEINAWKLRWGCVCAWGCVCVCVCVQCLPLLSFSPPPSQSFFSSLPKLSRSRSNGATEMHQEQAALLKSDRREEQGRMTHVGEALSC